MMKTLSFLKPVQRGLVWVGHEFRELWQDSRFYYSPTERNLLLSLWYNFRHFKTVRPGATVLIFLDEHIVYIKRELENSDTSPKRKQLFKELLDGLYDPPLRKVIVSFLESPMPEKNYRSVIDTMRRAWRMDEEDGTFEGEVGGKELEGSKVEETTPVLNAKAYFIAAQLHFELAGKEAEFEALSRQMPDLMAFVQRQFGVERLPGTFDKLRGYSYKVILTGRNDSKKGQLKPCFRQIISHPQIFGEAIAARARQILRSDFD